MQVTLICLTPVICGLVHVVQIRPRMPIVSVLHLVQRERLDNAFFVVLVIDVNQ